MSFTTLDGRTFPDVNNALKICGVEMFSKKNDEFEKDVFRGRWVAHHVVKYLPKSNACMQYNVGIMFEYISNPEKDDIGNDTYSDIAVEVKLALIQCIDHSILCAETDIIRKTGRSGTIQHPDFTLPSDSSISTRRLVENFILEVQWYLERDNGYNFVIERDTMGHVIDALLN